MDLKNLFSKISFESDSKEQATKKDAPSHWVKCPECHSLMFFKEVENQDNICPKCNFHMRIGAKRRIEILTDQGTFVEYDAKASSGNTFGKTNVVAQSAIVHGGLRFISEEQKEKARAKMRTIVSQNLPQTIASISFTDSYPAMGPTEANKALLSILNDVSLSLGHEGVTAYDPGKRGAADISFVADYVNGLDGLGTMGNGAHTPKETVNLKTMNALIQRTAIFIYRLINMD